MLLYCCWIKWLHISIQSCLGSLQTILWTSWLVCALTCTVNCGTLYRQVCAFPNHVQSTEFTTGGLQSSCRNISRMISGNRMHLSSILSVMSKAMNKYVIFSFFLFNKFAKILNKLLSHCHYEVLFVEFLGK